MNININGLNINYKILGEDNKKEVILLHGWGANIDAFYPVAKKLALKFKVYIIDLPGFGESSEPKKEYMVSDYSKVIKEFIEKNNLNDPILIGHSFGGRVIIKLIGELGVHISKIVLIDSAGVKPLRGIKYYSKVYSYKLVKRLIYIFNSKDKADKIINKYRNKVGSTDYNNASNMMKKILINTVNENLTKYMKNIKSETLIIWGENDKDTPLRQAKIINKNIENSGLVVLKGAGHFSYLDNFNEFIVILFKFLESDMK